MSVPLGKMGLGLSRSLSQVFDSSGNEDPQSFRVRGREDPPQLGVLRERRRRNNGSGQSTPARSVSRSGTASEKPIFGIGGSVIRDRFSGTITPRDDGSTTPPATAANRTIRFPDEAFTHEPT
jgi:hypothetical protein